MAGNHLDELTVTRLLGGAVDPDDAPPGYAGVAALVRTVRRSESQKAAVPSASAIVAITSAIRATDRSLPAGRQGGVRGVVGKLLTWKALAIALPAMALTGGGAAAATGSLPGPAQSAVSGALSDVGISVPSGATPPSGGAGHAVGPDAAGRAEHGLCTAYQAAQAHGQGPDHGVAFRNLVQAAATAGESVSKFCAAVTGPSKGSAGTGGTSGPNGTTGPAGSGNPNGSNGTAGPAGSGNPMGSGPSNPHQPPASPAGPQSTTTVAGATSGSTPAEAPPSNKAHRH